MLNLIVTRCPFLNTGYGPIQNLSSFYFTPCFTADLCGCVDWIMGLGLRSSLSWSSFGGPLEKQSKIVIASVTVTGLKCCLISVAVGYSVLYYRSYISLREKWAETQLPVIPCNRGVYSWSASSLCRCHVQHVVPVVAIQRACRDARRLLCPLATGNIMG